jgi:gliding motility-associated-like protein
MKLIANIIILTLFSIEAFSQQYNNWVFGYYNGLNFNSDTPYLFKTSLPQSGSYNHISISDETGTLLFYSDGLNIYDSKNQLINKADSLSTCHHSVVLKDKNSSERYKLFTISSFNLPKGTIHRLYVTDIEATQNYCTVISKNTLIASDTFFYLVAVPHSNKRDYWLVTWKRNDSFYAFRYTKNGIDTIVKSPKNYSYTQNWDDHILHGRLLLSNNYKMIVELGLVCTETSKPYKSFADLYNFNNSTGKLDFNQVIENSFANKKINFDTFDIYNGAFSPNDSILYLTGNCQLGSRISHLRQYKIFASNIKNTRNLLYAPQTGYYVTEAINLAPDGKIYFLSHYGITGGLGNKLYVIEKPELYTDKCSIKMVFDSIKNTSVTFSFPQTFYEPLKLSLRYKFTCNNTNNFINTSDTNIYQKFTWFFNGTDSIVGKDVFYEFSKSGLYKIILKGETRKGYTRYGSDTVRFIKKPKANFFTTEKTGCQWVGFQFNDISNYDTVNNVIGKSWLWDFGDGTFSSAQNPIHIYTKSGVYDVKLIFSNGFCSDSILIKQAVDILPAPKPGFTLNNDNFCTPFTLKIKDESVGAVKSWHYSFGDGRTDTSSSPEVLYTIAGNYLVIQTLTSTTGCITSDSANLFLRKGFDGSEQVNFYTVNVLSANNIDISWQSLPDAYSYKINRVSDAANVSFYQSQLNTSLLDTSVFTSKSIYSYTIYGVDSCGKLTGPSRYLRNILLTGISTGNDMAIIKWNPFEQWQNGVKEYMIEVHNSISDNYLPVQSSNNTEYSDMAFTDNSNSAIEKCYRIIAYELDGNNQQSISNILCLPFQPMIWIPNSFSPNGDNLNDIFKPVCLGMLEYDLKIYNRWGVLIYYSISQEKGWNGEINGEMAETGMYFYSIRARGKDSAANNLCGELYLIK